MSARPSWLKSAKTLATMGPAAVVISGDGKHVAVGFRDGEGKVWRAHLYFHCDLRKDLIPLSNSWVFPAIDEERLTLVAQMCERVIERNESYAIRFGFRFDKTRFDRGSGEIVLGDDELGLTCATFVLAVFKSVGIDLLEYGEWPPRPGDEARFEELLQSVREHSPEDKEHLEVLTSEMASVRFRPEEVAAAGAQGLPPPCPFNVAESEGARLIQSLKPPAAQSLVNSPTTQQATPLVKQPRAKTK
jgi:hypothetical protein